MASANRSITYTPGMTEPTAPPRKRRKNAKPERRFVNLHMPRDMYKALEQYARLTNTNKHHIMLTGIARKIGYLGSTGTINRPPSNPGGAAHQLSQNQKRDD